MIRRGGERKTKRFSSRAGEKAAGKREGACAGSSLANRQGRRTAAERAAGSRELSRKRGAGERERGRSSRRPLSERFKASWRTIIVFLIIIFFFGFAAGPVSRSLSANSRLREAELELQRQRGVTASLERQVKEASTMEFVEVEARKQRLVKEGEQLYLVTADGEGRETVYRVKGIQSKEEAKERVRKMMNSSDAYLR